MIRGKEKGQAMAEFALIMPVLILLIFGMTFAAFYAFRSAATNWGVFITGLRRVHTTHLQPNMPVTMFYGPTWQIESMPGRPLRVRCGR